MLLLRLIENLKKARAARKKGWESLCKKCGICCYEKLVIGFKASIDYAAPCRYLESDNSCSVYPDRFSRCTECRPMTIWHALFAGYLPISCGYVEKYRIWNRSSR